MALSTAAAAPTTWSSLKRLRKQGGLPDRQHDWLSLLQLSSSPAVLADYGSHFRTLLSNQQQRCEGCEQVLETHVYGSVGGFFFADDGGVDDALDKHMFALHFPQQQQQQQQQQHTSSTAAVSAKRILMALEIEFDFDNSYSLMDLVCLCLKGLNGSSGNNNNISSEVEVEAHAVMRRLLDLNAPVEFVKCKPADGGGKAPPRSVWKRRMLSCTSFTHSLHSAQVLIQIVRQKHDAKLASVLAVDEVQYWLDRWLVPILPLDECMAVLDCVVAGDDLKLLMRVCLSAILACKHELLSSSSVNTPLWATRVIQQQQQGRQRINLNMAFPTRKRLNQMLLLAARSSSSSSSSSQQQRYTKLACAHVPRHLVSESRALQQSFDLASSLCSLVPRSHRYGLLHGMARVKLRDNELSTLYKACEEDDKGQSSSGAAYVLLISCNAVDKPNDLNYAAARGDDDGNLVVFGCFTTRPFVCSRGGAGGGGSAGFVFQLQPAVKYDQSAATTTTRLEEVQYCTRSSLSVGQGALRFLNNMDTGTSERCAIFNSPPLCRRSRRSAGEEEEPGGMYCFKTVEVELWRIPAA